jgi:hypothetical protein
MQLYAADCCILGFRCCWQLCRFISYCMLCRLCPLCGLPARSMCAALVLVGVICFNRLG